MKQSYYNFSENQNSLIDSAKVYAVSGDFSMAGIFLETVLMDFSGSNSTATKVEKKQHNSAEWQFQISSGIDYNRQEFELGYSLEDSTLLDEVTKPFLSLGIGYDYNSFSFNNNFRSDKENITNILSTGFNGDLNSLKYGIEGKYIFDKNSLYEELSFNELSSNIVLEKNIVNQWNWYLSNRFRYKNYQEPTQTVSSFYRNMASLSLSRNYNYFHFLQLSYYLDYNQSINSQNNDYTENNLTGSYRGEFRNVRFNFDSNYRIMDFKYVISDSLIENKSFTFLVNPTVSFQLEKLSFNLNFKYSNKNYNKKTEQEPDYIQWRISPGFEYNFSTFFSIYLNYFFEEQIHKTHEDLENIYIEEQNYNSNGLELGYNYTSLSGFLISGAVTFSSREYPNKLDASTFSLYSSRDILSLFLFAQIPVWKNISASIIALYDNDKDKDFDNNDTQSSFYTVEIKYSF